MNSEAKPRGMKPQEYEMKCPKCGRIELRETPEGVKCRVCGYILSPGQADKFRLFQLLRDEAGKKG